MSREELMRVYEALPTVEKVTEISSVYGLIVSYLL